jgi:hypothetical protein
LEWKVPDPYREMSIFNQQPDADSNPGIDDKESPLPPPPGPNLIPNDGDADSEAGRIEERSGAGEENENENENENESTSQSASRNTETQAAVTAMAKSTRLGREMRKLAVSFNPEACETMNTRPTVIEDDSGEEITEQINFCFDAIYLGTTIWNESDYEVPTGILDALNGKMSDKWTQSAAKEVMNFISQNCWKKVSRAMPQSLDRKIMKMMWALQVKDEHDGSIRLK